MDNTDNTSQKTDSAPKKTPEGESVNWVTQEIHWPFPTWIEKDLYDTEFRDTKLEVTAQLLVNMFNNLGTQIDKALAGGTADIGSLEFKYWRKLSNAATKMKPARLKATLFAHPDYGTTWMLVEYA